MGHEESDILPMPLRDRLTAGTSGRPATTSWPRRVDDFRQSVREDLEKLLNTRWRCTSWPPALKELDRSLVNYGLPDFTGASFNHPNQQREFQKIIERQIRHFEPRLSRVRVSLTDGQNPDRAIRFMIEGDLQLGSDAEPVSFETTMETASSSFRVGVPR